MSEVTNEQLQKEIQVLGRRLGDLYAMMNSLEKAVLNRVQMMEEKVPVKAMPVISPGIGQSAVVHGNGKGTKK